MEHDEKALLERLKKVEALFAGAATDGEREAARTVAEQIRARLAAMRAQEPDVEFQCSIPDPWAQRLFVALCRRYGLSPYRRSGQRRTTFLVKAPRSFMAEVVWPEFQALAKELTQHLETVTERLIRKAIHDDTSEAEVLEAPRGLGRG